MTLIGLVLILAVGKQAQTSAVLISLGVCCLTGVAAIQVLEPVLSYMRSLENLLHLDTYWIKNLFQIAGICMITEIIAVICADAGCLSLEKSIRFLANSMILYLSVPVFENMILLIREIMGGL